MSVELDKMALPQLVHFPNPLNVPGDRPFIWSHGVSVDLLIECYAHGIFPWPGGEGPIGWHSPDPRGVLFFKDFHLPKNFVKELKRMGDGVYRCTWCEDFDAVIEGCRSVRRAGDAGTWITEEMIEAYRDLFKIGGAWSVEVWEEVVADGEDARAQRKLVGGLYGTKLFGVYGGESMFSIAPNASKHGLVFLRDHLMSLGVEWIDTQTLSPVIEQFGGVLISRSRFFQILRDVQGQDAVVR